MIGLRFSTITLPVLSQETAVHLISARRNGKPSAKVSLDLGLTTEEVKLGEAGVVLRDQQVKWGWVDRASRRRRDVFVAKEGRLKSVSLKGEHFYKLVPCPGGAPTLEIDGIHMHRVSRITPDQDARMKVRALGFMKCSRVLDTCTGLGYTAIESLKAGACEVITVEKDPNVLYLARFNPWSRGLSDPRIQVVMGDCMQLIKKKRSFFDFMVHDPPRLALAGDLYSTQFYQDAFNSLRPGGRMIHYVGQPGLKFRGKRIVSGVKRRLATTGFRVRHLIAERSVLALK